MLDGVNAVRHFHVQALLEPGIMGVGRIPNLRNGALLLRKQAAEVLAAGATVLSTNTVWIQCKCSLHYCMHAGRTAYQIEQRFGEWHVWVPTSELGDSECTAEDVRVEITASELAAGAAGGVPYLEVRISIAPAAFADSACVRCRLHTM